MKNAPMREMKAADALGILGWILAIVGWIKYALAMGQCP